MAMNGRWCDADVWLNEQSYGPCGGELRFARRLEGELIVTYLQCLFCGKCVRRLEHDLATHEDRVLPAEVS